jgi:DNA-binding transcriptional LysR family regulator
MQIKRLEAMLEQTQFVREARSVRLNAEGEMLLGYSRRILKLNAEAVSKFLAPTLEGREDGDAFLRPPASHFGKTWMYMAKNRSERSERSE